MKIKRFNGTNTRDVLQQIRVALGPDAVILSNREVAGEVEIVAAIDFDEKQWEESQAAPAWPESLRNVSEVAPTTQVQSIPLPEHEPVPAIAANPSDIDSPAVAPTVSPPLRSELQALKQLVEKRWGSQNRGKSARESLAEMGFSSGWINALLGQGEIPDWEKKLRQKLEVEIGISQVALEKRGIFILLGPTGSGKTTSIAKLAAAQVLRHGPHSVALLTTDTYRIAGVEQLDIYARILGVPLDVIRGPEDLLKSLDKHRERPWIFIDTIGMSPRDPRLGEQLQWLAALGADAQRFLMIPASLGGQSLSTVLAPYAGVPLNGAILSKVDETPAFGAVIEWLAAQHLPIAWYSDGQKVPEDMHEAPWDSLLKILHTSHAGVAKQGENRYHGLQYE